MNIILIISTLWIATLFGEKIPEKSNIIDNEEGLVFFKGTWQETLEKAEKEDKLIFLDAYASWCGPCKAMQQNVFPTQKLGEFYNANFINVKIDMEKGEGPALSAKYGVRAYPSLFFIDSDGQVVKSALGYQNVNKLLKLGEDALK
jgi:thioredoxin 1